MIHLALPNDFPQQRLPFYLAMEEWAARRLSHLADDIFFIWQSEPTVIFGRNQRISKEVDLEYCRQHGIQYYRRRSGGGCVFSDSGNIMMSYITTANNVVTTFSDYTGMVSRFLQSLGLDASNTSRNDVLIGDRKVSGNAFYHIPGRCIAHGTMLYSINRTDMAGAITPSKSKLESKGVKSVESRVTCISEHLPQLSIEDFKRRMVDSLTDARIELTETDIAEIHAIEALYYDPRWIHGKDPEYNARRYVRIDNIGEIYADLRLSDDGTTLLSMSLSGDFFMLSDLDELLKHMPGACMTPDGIRSALAGVDPSRIIPGLTIDHIVSLMFDGQPSPLQQ